jgi:prephenate dehydrogenase
MKVAIIGGGGKMGRWFAGLLKADGCDIVLSGRNRQNLENAGREMDIPTAAMAEAVTGADIILISVNIDSLEAVISGLAPHVRPEQVIIEITSVKTLPTRLMRQYLPNSRWLGVHPMFGPGARNYRGQNFILTPTDENDGLVARVREFLERKGGRVNVMSPTEHDEMMTVILGLSHFIAIVTADCLLDFKGLEKTRPVSSTTYKVLLDLVESVVAEDPSLYGTLQMNLPQLPELEALFCEKGAWWADVVKRRDFAGFTGRMQSLKEHFQERDPDFINAYDNLYRLTDNGHNHPK